MFDWRNGPYIPKNFQEIAVKRKKPVKLGRETLN